MRLWLCALVLTAGCHKKTDAERAAEERAEARKRVDSSLVLVPYRSLKTVVRASAQTPAPPELAKLIQIFSQMKPAATPANLLEEARQVGELVVGLYRARSIVNQHDEDGYPTLWRTFLRTPHPLPWYSSKVEHLGLAVAAWLFEVSLNKDPVADVLFYEIDRAQAEPGWPAPLMVASQGTRGMAYMSAGYHYAAEEELTGYLNNLAAADAPTKAMLGLPMVQGGPPLLTPLEVGGYLARAWNRFALGRDDPANDDLEAALTRLDQLGVQDELVDWGWALVHARRGRYPQASERLEKLAASPNLSDDEKAQIKEFAASMEKKKGAVLFGRQRAQFILVRAVVAREGGLEKLLCKLFGDETGKQIYEPLAFFHRLSAAVTGAGHKGLDALKDKLK